MTFNLQAVNLLSAASETKCKDLKLDTKVSELISYVWKSEIILFLNRDFVKHILINKYSVFVVFQHGFNF